MTDRARRVLWAVIVTLFVFIGASAPFKMIQAHTTPSSVVTLANLAFAPRVLTVSRGTTVTFQNHDVSPHTVTADDGSFDSGVLTPGKTFELVLRRSIEYHCSIHPFMTARILVT